MNLKLTYSQVELLKKLKNGKRFYLQCSERIIKKLVENKLIQKEEFKKGNRYSIAKYGEEYLKLHVGCLDFKIDRIN